MNLTFKQAASSVTYADFLDEQSEMLNWLTRFQSKLQDETGLQAIINQDILACIVNTAQLGDSGVGDADQWYNRCRQIGQRLHTAQIIDITDLTGFLGTLEYLNKLVCKAGRGEK